ncbi:hypothetical protein HK100_011910 [Physocladia obscura]|uniref:Uncharacterized protein n=1 Tax=Physocladia obscura TaxID=109957 RepID=A0AAD5T0I8_9FUNG|nr:hypothetical protein HK100_011910 [Physocladia obscura]
MNTLANIAHYHITQPEYLLGTFTQLRGCNIPPDTVRIIVFESPVQSPKPSSLPICGSDTSNFSLFPDTYEQSNSKKTSSDPNAMLFVVDTYTEDPLLLTNLPAHFLKIADPSIFSPDPTFAPSLSALMRHFASKTSSPPVSLQLAAFEKLHESLKSCLVDVPPSNTPDYWQMLLAHMTKYSPNDTVSPSYSISPMGNISAQISIPGFHFTTSFDDFNFSTTPTPVANARNDAARLALSFLKKFHAAAGAISQHIINSQNVDKTNEPLAGVYISALNSFFKALRVDPPVYSVIELDGGLGYSASVSVISMLNKNHRDTYYCPATTGIFRKSVAKERAAKVACESLSIPVTVHPINVQINQLHSQSSKNLQIEAQQAASVRELYKFSAENKIAIKFEFPLDEVAKLDGKVAKIHNCRVSIEKFGVWESGRSFRHKSEAKNAAAENALEGIGLRKSTQLPIAPGLPNAERVDTGILNAPAKKSRVVHLLPSRPPQISSFLASQSQVDRNLSQNLVTQVSDFFTTTKKVENADDTELEEGELV